MAHNITLIECPRDAMQGVQEFIPTEKKAEYINAILQVGFDTIDFGSFVSPSAIPQMADTALVLSKLDLSHSRSKLLAIVANLRGATEACMFSEIDYLGFPFSISETFQQRNTNKSIAESLVAVQHIQNLCIKHGKEQVIYISMGFGNPYGDTWSAELAMKWVDKIVSMGIKVISLADTVGVAKADDVAYMFKNLIPAYPDIEFGAHLHSTPDNWMEKLEAAYKNGCMRFDHAIKGYGGCPMAQDSLVGNMATENVLFYLQDKVHIDTDALNRATQIALDIFAHN